MRHVLLVTLLTLVAASAFAQTPIVLTNKDLGKPMAQKIVLTPEQWQALVDRQFHYVPPPRWSDYYGGARVAVSNWTMPTAEALQRSTYPLQTPFYMSTYVGPTIGVYPLGALGTRGHGHR